MAEFRELWAKMSKSERLHARAEMERSAMAAMPTFFKMRSTDKQLRAAAKKRVDILIALSKAQPTQGPQRDDL